MVETQKEGSEVAPYPHKVEGAGGKLQSLSPRYPNQTPERGALGVPAPCAR